MYPRSAIFLSSNAFSSKLIKQLDRDSVSPAENRPITVFPEGQFALPTKLQATYVEKYEDESSDIKIQTSDGVVFHLHRWLLGKSSPILHETIKKHAEKQTTEAPIQIEWTAATFSTLLDYVYPFRKEAYPMPLDKVEKSLNASIALEMDAVTSILREHLVAKKHLSTEPLRVWAIACRLGLENEEKIALRKAKEVDLDSDESFLEVPIMANLPAIHYVKLLHRKAKK
jgi:hypothetical protein